MDRFEGHAARSVPDRLQPASVQEHRVHGADANQYTVMSQKREEQRQRRPLGLSRQGHAQRKGCILGGKAELLGDYGQVVLHGQPSKLRLGVDVLLTVSKKKSTSRVRKRSSSRAGTVHAYARSSAMV